MSWSFLTPLVMAAAAAALGAHAFVSWELLAAQRNAPVADWAGLALLATGALWLWGQQPLRRVLPAPRAALAFFGIAALSCGLSDAPHESIYEWLRKGVFSYLAYAAGLAAVLSTLPRPWLARLQICSTLLIAGIGLLDSPGRVATMGWTTPWGVGELAQNHKVLAVALAPQLPLLGWSISTASGRWRQLGQAARVLSILWIMVSFSRSAWIIAVCAGLLTVRSEQRQRWGLVAAALLSLAVLAAAASVGRTDAIGDAATARSSLLLRAGTLMQEAPLLGHGLGASVRHVAHDWPHVRMNGVEAHGVLQKLGAETGLLGLLAWLMLAVGLTREASRGPRAAADTAILLHLMLLFSTEALTASHWVPLGLSLGISRSSPTARPPAGAALGLWVGAGLLGLMLLQSNRGTTTLLGGSSIRATIDAFERARAAPGTAETRRYWAPRQCTWNEHQQSLSAICHLVQQPLSPASGLEAPANTDVGLYMLTLGEGGLQVEAAERRGLRLP